jgi:hypothetical protein
VVKRKTHVDYSFVGLLMEPCDSLEESFSKYGMDFVAEKRPLRFPDRDGKYKLTSPRHMQMVNTRTDRPIWPVGINYMTMQYPDAYDVCKPLIVAGSRIVGGGCPNNGERAYMVLEAKQKLVLSDGDEIVNRYTILSSHDGKGKIEVRSTPYRGLSGIAYTTDADHPLAFKHTKRVHERVAAVKRIFRNLNKNWEMFEAGARKMMAIHLNADQAREFVESMFPCEEEKVPTRTQNMREEVLRLFYETGIGTRMPQCKNTLFGLVEAFSEWADTRKVRKSELRDEIAAGIDSRLVADGAKKKAKAWGMALRLIKIGERTKGAFGSVAA